MLHKTVFFIMLCIISKSFMCVEQKCNFNVRNYDIMVISVDTDFLLPNPDQGDQNDADSDTHH